MITVSRCAIFRSPLVEWAGLDWAACMGGAGRGPPSPPSSPPKGAVASGEEPKESWSVFCFQGLETFCDLGEGVEEALALTGREGRMGRESDSKRLTARSAPATKKGELVLMNLERGDEMSLKGSRRRLSRHIPPPLTPEPPTPNPPRRDVPRGNIGNSDIPVFLTSEFGVPGF